MSLRLAPYNDAMRLGQGFNSYTHELCIDGAIDVRQRTISKDVKRGHLNPSQVVSYSARCVEKLSDIVEAMNLSYSSSIKKGTIEISGNSTTVDENTFKVSDLNVVVSVRVVNQTIAVEDEAKFVPLVNQEATAARFNEIYGDSYISGFIEGGDFSGIVSIKVIDRSNVNSVVNTIKASLLSTGNNDNPSSEAEEFSLGPSIPPGEGMRSTELSAALKDTQTTISINWMGGGQIKEPAQSWDIDSMYAAAAAFPASVAQCPQRTWAILTPYKANRSFVNWTMQSPVKTLQYDLIASYTAELFDRFMDYKLLLKRAQHILTHRKSYRQRIGVANAIGTEVTTLLCLRAALRNEQTKIVEAIEVLGKDPGVLKRQAAWTNGHKSEVVRRIVEKALGEFKDWQPEMTSASTAQDPSAEGAPAAPFPPAAVGSADPTQKTVEKDESVAEETKTSDDAGETEEDGESKQQEKAEDADEEESEKEPAGDGAAKPLAKQANTVNLSILSSNTSGTAVPGLPSSLFPAEPVTGLAQIGNPAASVPAEPSEFNFDTLIAPELWEDLLPEPLEPIDVPLSITAPVTNVGPLMGPGIGGLTSFTLTAPPPDDQTGPASMVITSQSYADMEKNLKAAKEAQTKAQAELATLQATHATLQANFSALQAKQAALEQAARQATDRATGFEQQAKTAESARAQAASELQVAQKTINDLNADLLSAKTTAADVKSTLERSLAAETARADKLSNDRMKEQNAREDVQRKLDACQAKINAFKDTYTGVWPQYRGNSMFSVYTTQLILESRIPGITDILGAKRLWE